MPPKSGNNKKDAALKNKIKDKRKKVVTPYPAQLLSEVNSRRGGACPID